MTSPAPLEFGEFYHIFNRGNNREDIFVEERNYGYFLRLAAKHVAPIADIFAYCLMRNHFHLLVRIKLAEEQETAAQTRRVSETLRVYLMQPSRQFGHLFNAYAKAVNKAYARTGSLFQNPFGRVHVSSDAHFVQLIAYTHQNPQKHGFVRDFRDWPHSSYHPMIATSPRWLRREEVLEWFGGAAAYRMAHEREVGEALELLVPDDPA